MGLFPNMETEQQPEQQGGLAFLTDKFACAAQPLAEKYRPRKLADFLGLEKPRKVLTAFSQRPMPSAWLFVGPPGTGKTTMAQSLCETIKGEWHHIPSQRCTAQAIDEVVRMCWYWRNSRKIPNRRIAGRWE